MSSRECKACGYTAVVVACRCKACSETAIRCECFTEKARVHSFDDHERFCPKCWAAGCLVKVRCGTGAPVSKDELAARRATQTPAARDHSASVGALTADQLRALPVAPTSERS